MSARRPRGRFLAGTIFGILLSLVLGALVVAPLALAHRGTGVLEAAYGDAAVGLTSRLGARGVGENPVAATPRAIETGQTAYNGACVQCHGAAGGGDGIFGRTTFPPATDLTAGDAREKSDAQLFYIIKNGLGFTPMPGYNEQYADQTIWSLVSYVRTLQGGQGGAPDGGDADDPAVDHPATPRWGRRAAGARSSSAPRGAPVATAACQARSRSTRTSRWWSGRCASGRPGCPASPRIASPTRSWRTSAPISPPSPPSRPARAAVNRAAGLVVRRADHHRATSVPAPARRGSPSPRDRRARPGDKIGAR